MKTKSKNSLRVGLVVPHMFMNDDILPGVIFSPGELAQTLADGLVELGVDVTLFSPGSVTTTARNITGDLSLFERELAGRGYGYTELLRKHPVTFVTLARQVQAEIIARAYAMANADQLDVVHIYTNEEDLALPFAQFCNKPVVLTHHDPFNYLIKHKSIFPKYKHLNWVSISMAQRQGMPADTNWVGNVYHGLAPDKFSPVRTPSRDYLAYFGRIVEQKGVHLAIAAVKQYNRKAAKPLKLKIAGKHYASYAKDTYWKTQIEPQLGSDVEYVGFIGNAVGKQAFLGNAAATIMPSLFDEPFGMVAIESLACGTPVVALDNGAISEVVKDGVAGWVVVPLYDKTGTLDADATASALAQTLSGIDQFDSTKCRLYFERHFTLERMCTDYQAIYHNLLQQN